MRLTLTNGRTFTIKVKYEEIPKESVHKDEFGRLVETYWYEYKTQVTVEETSDKPESTIMFKGFSYCSYKDHYSKKTGRELAYFNAVSQMSKLGVVDANEVSELDQFKLNTWTQDNRKEK